MGRNVIGFSGKTFKYVTKAHVKKEILTSLESSKEFRDEIRRTFQQANRRIQNVEKSGIVSPAVVALNKGDIKGFTKFSMRHSWEELKTEYAKAVSFLQQPTSTASGTREYGKHLQRAYNLTDKEFKLMQDNLMNKIASVSDERFLEQYLMQYKDFTGELETAANDVSDMIESDAKQLQDSLNASVESASEQVTDEINRLLSNFEKFGL